ncbi:MAG: winged helix-turn-helix domain-containing protein [Novosphingobium sp.]
MRIMVAEDDREMADYVAGGLRELGHVVDVAHDGRDAFMLASGEIYDVLVLDRMLPGMDGIALIKTLRDIGNIAPALFLTALDGVSDRVTGLEAGGDDYLVKPFAFSELAARINALARRPRTSQAETELVAGPLRMDLLSRKVARSRQAIELQPQEFRLLEFLMRNAGRVVTRTMLLEGVWGFHFDPKTSVVETHISRLRAKIDRDFDLALIKTVRGAGYIIDA